MPANVPVWLGQFLLWVSYSSVGGIDRVWEDEEDFHQPFERIDRELHHGADGVGGNSEL